jgi:peptide/nickel transport system permease protein
MIDVYRTSFGLDKPLLEQYFNFLSEFFLHGNLGPSLISFPVKVQDLLWSRLPWSIGLLSISTVISWVIGIIIGSFAGWRQGKKIDKILSASAMIFSQIPFYIIAVLSALFLGYFLGWFPYRGAYSPDIKPGLSIEFLLSVIQYGTLPAFSIILTSVLSQILFQRALLITILGEDYLIFAESKGLTKRRMFFSYALRNSLLPQITNLGISLGFVMNGSYIVEYIFNYPGVGKLFADSILVQDYNTIMGCVIMSIFTTLTATLIIDILLPLIDPRLKSKS